MNDDLFYKKATMVLFSIEKAIGGYLLDEASQLAEHLSKKKFEDIKKRISGPLGSNPNEIATQYIRVSYLKELLEMLVEISRGTSKEGPAKRLFQCCEVIDVYDARNAIAHPIREFHPSYWYRIAAIASDTCLEEIGIPEPRAELDAAEDGDIREIDDSWWSRGGRYTQNNLPEFFDHESTKLIGRTQELEELIRMLCSKRYPVLAIVAPGGIGKTALVLEALNSFVHNLSISSEYDYVIYISLKQEELELSGVRKIDSPNTIASLREKVNEILNDQNLSIESTVLLCVDNLETVIQDDIELVQNYFDELPDAWKIVATSRIPFDGAKTLPLKGLDENSCGILIRKYAASMGYGAISSQEIISVIKGSAANPLAMRLNVDRLQAGGEVQGSIAKTGEDLVNFSFRGLVSALPTIAKNILEILFVVGRSERGEIASFFDDNSSEVPLGIAKLLQTSVVIRTFEEEEEGIEITEAVRLLLRKAPLDIEFRHEVSKALEEIRTKTSRHSKIQQSRNVNRYHEDYLSDDVPDYLASKLVDVVRFIRENNPKYVDYAKIERQCCRLEDLSANHKDYSEYWLMLARLRAWQRDEVSAKTAFENAVRLEESQQSSPRPTARLAYAKYLKRLGLADEAINIMEALLDGEWASKSQCLEPYFRIVWGSYFDWVVRSSQIDKAEKSLDKLRHCCESEGESFKFFQIQDAKLNVSKCSNLHKEDHDYVIDAYIKAARVVIKTIDSGTAGKSAYIFTWFLFKEVTYFLRVAPLMLRGDERLKSLLISLEQMLECFVQSDFIESRDRFKLNTTIKELINFEVNFENPFNTKVWRERAGIQLVSRDKVEKLERSGWVVCNVVTVEKKAMPGYVFCIDRDGNRYYIGRKSLVAPDLISWSKLEKNNLIAIRNIQDATKEGSYPSPSEITFL